MLADSVRWSAEVPAEWNGTLLLYSRGYSAQPQGPQVAPPEYRQVLLDKGYALAASDYGSGGWALAEAVPAQLQALDAFAARYGEPERVIAWGESMGGLVTTALAEQPQPRIDGGLALCSSIGGSLGMMNMALDGAFAFRTLAAPDSGIALVRTGDDLANAERVQTALARAMLTPEGRARVALAGVLAGIPSWTRAEAPWPAPDDAEAIVDEIAAAFVRGVFLPRADQEARAQGVFSWNTGIDYAAQLDRSARRALVEALYENAGLDLDADLARLAAEPRIEADPQAVEYMARNYTPIASPSVPLLALQAAGDGLTSPSMQRAYDEAADDTMMQSLFAPRAGHCTLSAEEVGAAIGRLEQRLETGRWMPVSPPFVEHMPAPMTRPCFRDSYCE